MFLFLLLFVAFSFCFFFFLSFYLYLSRWYLDGNNCVYGLNWRSAHVARVLGLEMTGGAVETHTMATSKLEPVVVVDAVHANVALTLFRTTERLRVHHLNGNLV